MGEFLEVHKDKNIFFRLRGIKKVVEGGSLLRELFSDQIENAVDPTAIPNLPTAIPDQGGNDQGGNNQE